MDSEFVELFRSFRASARALREEPAADSRAATRLFAETARTMARLEAVRQGPSFIRRLAGVLLVATLPCLALGAYGLKAHLTRDQGAYALFKQRATDLANLKNAVEAYKNDHGHYPVSHGFAGLVTSTGALDQNWIADITPRYLPRLPRDPRRDIDLNHQYLYNSNGIDYKLIIHHPDDCELARKLTPDRIDPLRGCLAHGYWTDGAKDW